MHYDEQGNEARFIQDINRTSIRFNAIDKWLALPRRILAQASWRLEHLGHHMEAWESTISHQVGHLSIYLSLPFMCMYVCS